MSISESIQKIKSQIPESVTLVAVSKTKPFETVLEAYQCGQKIFGENKVQELEKKYEHLPKDIEWHFIGHLQSNKVKYIAPFISMIHAVDSLKLLTKINEEAFKNNHNIKCLLQVHIAEETSKFGMSIGELHELLQSSEIINLQNVTISGVMGMASYTDDVNQIRNEFRFLKQNFDEIKAEYFNNSENFRELSMGMSGDFLIAVEEGSTMVRIGSNIFGERNY
jgi:pyridoxal phosphate enzyme (YggS family)